MIKWYGAFKIDKGGIKEKYIFPDEQRADIITRIREGDYSIIPFKDKHMVFEGELKDKRALISTAIEVAKKEMKEGLREDYILIENLNTYDDLISTINLLSERALEWDRIAEIKGKNMDSGDMLKKEIEVLEKLKDEIADEIDNLSKNVCPNLAFLVGAIIAARLISSAGGLRRLATLPASTIQVLGAEDAFFRHLKSGAKCPKHGIIFRVPWVRNSPKKLRGKIARTLAAKIAIAAKVDYYRGDFIGDKLKEDMEKRVEEIRK